MRVGVDLVVIVAHDVFERIHILYCSLISSEDLGAWCQLVRHRSSKSTVSTLYPKINLNQDHRVQEAIPDVTEVRDVVARPIAKPNNIRKISIFHLPRNLLGKPKKSIGKRMATLKFLGIDYHVLVVISSGVVSCNNFAPGFSVGSQKVGKAYSLPSQKSVRAYGIVQSSIQNTVCSLKHDKAAKYLSIGNLTSYLSIM